MIIGSMNLIKIDIGSGDPMLPRVVAGLLTCHFQGE